jgi:stage II sporulation protein E
MKFFVFFALSLLVSRVAIAGGLMPFGAAFIAAAFLNRKSANSLAVFCGSLASAFLPWKDVSFSHIILYCILYGLLVLTALVRIKRHLITSVTATLLACSTAFALFSNGLVYDSLMWVFETGISVVMVFVFNIAFSLHPGKKRFRTVLMDDEIISAAFVCLVLVLGFSDIAFLGIYLRNIVSVLLVLLFAYTGGLAVGAAVGVMLGFGVMLAGGDVAFMANLAMGALVAGLLNKTNRAAGAVGFLIINAIMTFFINNSAIVIIPLVDSLVAIGIFLSLPKKFLETVGTFVDANMSRLHAQKISIRRFRELTVGRLHEIAGIFANAAAIFEKPAGRTADSTLAVRGVRERVCRDCPITNYCWQGASVAADEFKRAFFEYSRSGYCELSGAFAKKCMKEHTVNAAMNDVFYLQMMNEKVVRQVTAARKVVGEQLSGVSKVISSLGREFEMDINFLSDLERVLKTRLDAAGIRAKEVSVEGAGDSVTACVRVRSCGGTGACEGRVKNIVSSALGRRMELEKQLCRMGAETCDLKFLPKKKFLVAAHAISVQKYGKAVCGDAAATAELKDGRFMLLVCDGMGSGERAAERSRAAVVLTRNFYNAGFGDETVIGSINKLLMLSSPDDTYSTMDICMIDRNSGEAVFTKIGSPVSYVWRGGSILKVNAGALPIGILEDVKPFVKKMELRDGDMIVMFTDGIADLAVDMTAFVKNCVAFESPENAAGEMIRAALEISGGQAQDDMTVVVAKVRLVS